jgi:glutamine synthetase
MKSIEHYTITKMVLQKHFEKKGLIVSFVPLTKLNTLGNGAHAHLSLWKCDGAPHI